MAEVAERVRRFYNESPFPDFDLRRFETRAELPPPVGSVSHTLELAGLWNPAGQRCPSPLTRLVTQFGWIVSTHHEGGYWVTFGRRRNTDS